jgi:hypothetical protein
LVRTVVSRRVARWLPKRAVAEELQALELGEGVERRSNAKSSWRLTEDVVSARWFEVSEATNGTGLHPERTLL